MRYSMSEERLLADFFQAEQDRIARFLKQRGGICLERFANEDNHVDFAALVNNYASNNGYHNGELLKLFKPERVVNNKILWQHFAMGVAYTAQNISSKAPQVKQVKKELPGIPLGENTSLTLAMQELDLLKEDAKKAIRPFVPKGGVIKAYGHLLYHDTQDSSRKTGAKNGRGANKITYFYEKENDQYYLVAWGHHTGKDIEHPKYVVDRQVPQLNPPLSGELTFQ